MAATPPVDGVDCAPDFEQPAAVTSYLGFCVATTGALAAVTGPTLGVAALAGTALVTHRDDIHAINDLQAASHAGSIMVAARLAGALAKAVTGRSDVTGGSNGYHCHPQGLPSSLDAHPTNLRNTSGTQRNPHAR